MRYDRMVEEALRGVVSDALTIAAEKGLTGDHHFYITFRTPHPGVVLADYLRDRYPNEMTVVLQHQFYGLEVFDDRFTVTLSFNNVPERLVIPFDAIAVFADPSVNFALQFQPTMGEEQSEPRQEPPQEEGPPPEPRPEPEGEDDNVVSLETFRRKE